MEIILGRDEKTRKLKAVVDGKQTKLLGAEGSVNDYVSRQHISLTTQPGTGKYVLKNLKAGNATFVNGLQVAQKIVTRADRVELGAHRYLLDWDLVQSLLPKIADVRPLRDVWNAYQQDIMKERIAQGKFNALRSVLSIFSIAAIASSFIPGAEILRIPLYAIFAIGLIVVGVISYINATKQPLRQQKRQKDFQLHYVCPCCGHFFGAIDYDVVMPSKETCPNCKAKLVK